MKTTGQEAKDFPKAPRCHTGGHPGVSKGALRGDFTISPQRRGGGEKCLEEKGLKLLKIEQSFGGSSTSPHLTP